MAEPGRTEIAKNVALITLARVGNWEELNAPNEAQGNTKFIEKTRELWKEFAVHGVFGVDRKGEKTILNFTDLDGKCALGLLKLAGIDTSDVSYVAPSAHVSGRINLDTGDKHGVVIEDEGRTAFFDHHDDTSGNGMSATELVYEGLMSVGLLRPEKYLDELTNFVTQVDNSTFPGKEKLFDDSYRTVLGLRRFMQFDKLLAFFKAGRKPDALLDGADLKWLELEKRSNEQKKIVEDSKAKLAEFEKDGLILDTERYGKVVIDIGKKLPAGYEAVRAGGFQSYVIWAPEERSFFISSSRPLEFSLPQGMKVRETMWVKPRHDTEPLKVSLGEILEKLSGGSFTATGKLKEYLEKSS